MTELVNINHRGERVLLDDLWREAEKLGRVEVEQRIITPSEYSVKIRMDIGESRLWATGRDKDIIAAVQAAIAQARMFLGAAGR